MPRTNYLGVRLSDDELARLRPAAAAAGMSPAACLRRLALASLTGEPQSLAAPAPPATAGCLTRTVGTRLTAEQYAALADRAQQCGLPVAAFIRRTLLGLTPAARPRRADVRPAIAALNQVGNNLNRLTKLAQPGLAFKRAHRGRAPRAAQPITEAPFRWPLRRSKRAAELPPPAGARSLDQFRATPRRKMMEGEALPRARAAIGCRTQRFEGLPPS